MGNRAVICFDEYNDNAIGLYLHWNGGRDSIEGFLRAARDLMGSRLGDALYSRARLVQVIGTFMEGNLSFGMGLCANLDCDNYDNGVYVIDSSTLTIKGRVYHNGSEQSVYDANDIADYIGRKLEASSHVEE